ncbi:Stf0 family sulfotransferase [Aurantiacibacter zhengii]|uniref:Sulphotransferase Stf0 domain-containing protein n=1 Tax=Aurantiacibacter zhengii TaxID=2307003 RepID=A0A418NX96_9SPHN|nr:Stf0 family sulfotransferase [Aurantiacibacter zhengii]RIV89242.1 hypothetical protein D2V07_03115 [Aurantiacibacter zhengii]
MSVEGIITGHEERFDWPEFAGLAQPYILASVPRTGSTYLSHLLWRTGCLGAPLEYLNFQPSGPQGAVSTSPEGQIKLWKMVLARRTSPNGVFGVKAFPLQMEELARTNPALLASAMRFLLRAGPASKVVQLRRRDEDAHAISLARASLSGIWRAEQEAGPGEAPEYSEAVVLRARHELAIQEKAWQQMYRETGITPLVLWYEDVVENPDEAVAQTADYLGVTLDPAQQVDVPHIRQQDQTGANYWRARHADGGSID